MKFPAKLELLDGTGMWRTIESFEHGHLCRTFNLDPIRFYFDLPSSCRGVGSNLSGSGGNRGNRRINGYVMQRGRDEPFGKVTIIEKDDKIRDDDPADMRDFYNLDRWR